MPDSAIFSKKKQKKLTKDFELTGLWQCFEKIYIMWHRKEESFAFTLTNDWSSFSQFCFCHFSFNLFCFHSADMICGCCSTIFLGLFCFSLMEMFEVGKCIFNFENVYAYVFPKPTDSTGRVYFQCSDEEGHYTGYKLYKFTCYYGFHSIMY